MPSPESPRSGSRRGRAAGGQLVGLGSWAEVGHRWVAGRVSRRSSRQNRIWPQKNRAVNATDEPPSAGSLPLDGAGARWRARVPRSGSRASPRRSERLPVALGDGPPARRGARAPGRSRRPPGRSDARTSPMSSPSMTSATDSVGPAGAANRKPEPSVPRREARRRIAGPASRAPGQRQRGIGLAADPESEVMIGSTALPWSGSNDCASRHSSSGSSRREETSARTPARRRRRGGRGVAPPRRGGSGAGGGVAVGVVLACEGLMTPGDRPARLPSGADPE